MKLTNEQINAAKAKGFLLNRGTDRFSGRLVGKGGVFSADQLSAVSECARTFGDGTAIMTSRLCIEITGIPFDKLDAADAFVREKTGLGFGGTGAKVRPVTACKGTTCVYGNIDTRALAAEIHDRYYIGASDVKLPHKFKIGIGGCPNSCMKPTLNDFGIEGARIVKFNADKCRGCNACAVEKACRSGAVSFADGKIAIDADKCRLCGVCAGKCPFGVTDESESVCRVYVGGTWGRNTRVGTPLNRLFTTQEAVDLIGRTMKWYADNGKPKERLGVLIDRVGMDRFTAEVLD